MTHEQPPGARERDPKGKYTYSGKLGRICARCGQPFGVHKAAPPHSAGDYGVQVCSGFKPKKKGKK